MVIPDGGAGDSGPQVVEGPGGDGSGLSPSGLKSSPLSSGLVEPGPDVGLPVLPEVDVGEDVVVLDH